MTNYLQLKNLQKFTIIAWGISVGIFCISTILQLYPAFTHPARSLVFNDGLKQLVISVMYAYIALSLFRLIYTKTGTFINLVSDEGQKKIYSIWYCLVSLLLTKLVFNEIIVRFVLPKASDAALAESMGYFRNGGLKLQPHTDLIIAIVMAWIFLLVLSHAIQLKKEQDLTI